MIALILFVFGAAVVLYILLGYPVLLRLWPALAPKIRKDMEFRPTVTVILAVRNGAGFLTAKLESILGRKSAGR